MTEEMIKKNIFDILEESGIYIDESEKQEDLDLIEFLIDSIQYVYLIVELENHLGIELPDEVILYDNFLSINGFANMVAEFFENPNSISDKVLQICE